MAIDEKIKRAVIKEWLEFFPELCLFTPRKLYKILGNSIVGIEIDSNGEWYGAYFVIYPLYGNIAGIDLKNTLTGPMVFVNKRRGSLIGYIEREEKHKIKPKQELKEDFGVLLQGDITLANLLNEIDTNLLVTPDVVESRGDILELYVFKIFTSLYAGDIQLAQDICNSITPEKVKWKAHNLSECYSGTKNPFIQGSTCEELLNNIQKVIDNPAPMLKIIETHKADPKLRKLKRSEILLGVILQQK